MTVYLLMYSTIAMEIGKTECHIMPVSWNTPFNITAVHVHADVVQRVWSTKPVHTFIYKIIFIKS